MTTAVRVSSAGYRLTGSLILHAASQCGIGRHGLACKADITGRSASKSSSLRIAASGERVCAISERLWGRLPTRRSTCAVATHRFSSRVRAEGFEVLIVEREHAVRRGAQHEAALLV